MKNRKIIRVILLSMVFTSLIIISNNGQRYKRQHSRIEYKSFLYVFRGCL